MSKFPLDLSKFKRVSSTPESTELHHEDGHRLTLNHSALDPKKLSALNGLPLLQQENKLPNKPMKFADAGTVPNPTPNVSPEPEAEAPTPEEPPIQNPSAEQPESQAAPEQSQPSEAPVSSEMPQEQLDSQPEAPPKSAEQAFSTDKGNNLGIVAQEDAGMAHDLYQGHITPKTYGDLLGDKSALGKIGSVFGLILGGMGAGLTHTENPVIAMWDKQIANDIEAQKTNISNKQTLLSLNKSRFPDVESAVNFTRMQENRIYLHHLAEKASQLPLGSPARANADQALAAVGQFVDTQNYKLSDQIASKQAFIKSFQGQSGGDEGAFQAQQNMLRRGTPEQRALADENEKHHVPGIPGQSSVPLSPDDRATLRDKAIFNDRIKDFINFAQKNGGSLDPRLSAIGHAKANELSGLYRAATKGGVYKEGEAHFINQLIDSDPLKFFNVVRGVIPKAQELLQANSQSLESYKKSYGFPSPQGQNSGQQGSGEIVRRDRQSGKNAVFGPDKTFLRWQ